MLAHGDPPAKPTAWKIRRGRLRGHALSQQAQVEVRFQGLPLDARLRAPAPALAVGFDESVRARRAGVTLPCWERAPRRCARRIRRKRRPSR